MAATAPTQKRTPSYEPPEPSAIVRFYPNPLSIVRAYVESDFATELATEHERQVKRLTAEAAEVTDAESFARVGERLVELAGHRKTVEAWFKPIKDFAFRLHRMICEREAAVLKPLIAFESAAKTNWDRFRREEEAKRLREEQRLADEAREREQLRLQEEAALLEKRGESEVAQQVLEEAVAVQAPVIVLPSALPQTRGISARANWKWRPVGGDTPQARARAIALVPREFLCLDEKKLNAYAKAHEGTKRIPGIEFYDAGTVTVRG